MTYEVNENHFFDLVGINQIKDFTYQISSQEYQDEILKAIIEIDLTYYDNMLEEQFTKLSLPIELSVDDFQDDCLNVKNLKLFVIENQGVKLEFDLEVFLKDEKQKEVQILEDVANENEIEKNLIKDEYQESLEENMKKRDSNICTSDDKCSFNLENLKTSFKCYRVLFVDDEAKIDSYSNKYMVSMDELYHAKKHSQRLVVDVSGND